jgi:hypothetical protein
MLGIPSFALPPEVEAKLEIEVVEVKRPQSLEESSTRPYPSLDSPNDHSSFLAASGPDFRVGDVRRRHHRHLLHRPHWCAGVASDAH